MKSKSLPTDGLTPGFLPGRARRAARRRHRPNAAAARPGLHQLEALFAPWLPRHWLAPPDEGPGSRQRHWPRRRTFWTFLAQVRAPGSSCRCAVRQAQAQAPLEDQPVPADATSPYCQARRRFPVEDLDRFLDRVGATLEPRVDQAQRGCGQVVKGLDATTATTDDTPANQKAFPPTQEPEKGLWLPAPAAGGPLQPGQRRALGPRHRRLSHQ